MIENVGGRKEDVGGDFIVGVMGCVTSERHQDSSHTTYQVSLLKAQSSGLHCELDYVPVI